jgi:hypothetical protein
VLTVAVIIMMMVIRIYLLPYRYAKKYIVLVIRHERERNSADTAASTV